jgi:hypothetical protein
MKVATLHFFQNYALDSIKISHVPGLDFQRRPSPAAAIRRRHADLDLADPDPAETGADIV